MTSALVLVQPTGELWKKIRVDLNEDVKTRDSDLAAIKTWLKQQPHLPDEWEEQCLMTFLRGCSFSLEKTKRKLDMYFTMRTACPEFFTDRDCQLPELSDLSSRVQGPTLPGLTPEGRRVTICRGFDKDIETHRLNDCFKFTMMVGDVRLMEETEGVAGDVFILDAAVVKPSHLGTLSISLLKKFFICVQVAHLPILIYGKEAYPVKLKEVHVINASPLIDTVFNIVKPLLKEKLRNRVYFHKDIDGLHKYVPKEMLPFEYGGDAGSIMDLTDAWVKKLVDYTDWFKAQESVKADESLRPGKPTNYDELFGIDGSFRQLSID